LWYAACMSTVVQKMVEALAPKSRAKHLGIYLSEEEWRSILSARDRKVRLRNIFDCLPHGSYRSEKSFTNAMYRAERALRGTATKRTK
jgi:hypothetical protein